MTSSVQEMANRGVRIGCTRAVGADERLTGETAEEASEGESQCERTNET